MRRLIWAFAGRTYNIGGNLMSRSNFTVHVLRVVSVLDLSLCWSHIPHCWKSHVALKFYGTCTYSCLSVVISVDSHSDRNILYRQFELVDHGTIVEVLYRSVQRMNKTSPANLHIASGFCEDVTKVLCIIRFSDYLHLSKITFLTLSFMNIYARLLQLWIFI